MEVNAELYEIYIQETREHIENINECLLLIEKEPYDPENINNLFRSVHTIKGATAAVDFHQTAELIHKMEDLIQAVRDGKLELNSKMIQLLFVCHDYLENFIEYVAESGNEDGLKRNHIYEELCSFLRDDPSDTIVSNHNKEQVPQILRITSKDIDIMREKVFKDSNIYLLHIKISKDCAFISVSAWLIFEEIKKISEILISSPPIPSGEDFKNGLFDLKSDSIDLIVLTGKTEEQLNQELQPRLMEVEKILWEKIDLSNDPIRSDYLKFDNTTGCYSFCLNENSSEKPANPENNITNEIGKTYPIEFVQEITGHMKKAELSFLDLKCDQDNMSKLGKVYRCFHTIKGLAGYIDYTLIFEIAKETENLLDLCRKKKVVVDDLTTNLILNSIIFIKSLCENDYSDSLIGEIESHIHFLRSSMGDYVRKFHLNTKEIPPEIREDVKLGAILIEEGKIDQNTVDEVINLQKSNYPELKFGQVLVKEGKVKLKDVTEALSIQEKVKADLKNTTSIRISEQKLDNLLDMLGELIIVQSLHRENINVLLDNDKINKDKICNNVMRMERITNDIYHISLSMRMVSLKQTFQKLMRIGRDTSKELGKNVDLKFYGEETEIDRSIVEKIQDPLMHLLRNSIYHGIESEDERKGKGKPLIGEVFIKAYNKKGNIYIEIADDGKGLSTEKIYKKALEKNLIDKDRIYSEEDIFSFIFLPGFSTEENVNNISGRGVGMNVVESEIKKISGKVEIINQVGNGCMFILKIPVNLATINGTIVDIFGTRLIIPTINIKHIFKPDTEQWIRIKGKIEMVKLRDSLIQLIHIDKLLESDIGKDAYRDCVIIIVEHEKGCRALPVCSVMGKQEIVIKPLGNEFSHLKFLSGATILGDGKVSLILDIEALFKEISDLQ